MEIIRNYETAVVDAKHLEEQVIVQTAMAKGVITRDGGQKLIEELWKL